MAAEYRKYRISKATIDRAEKVCYNWRYSRADRIAAKQILCNAGEGATFDKKQKEWKPRSKPTKGEFDFSSFAKDIGWSAEEQVSVLMDCIENYYNRETLLDAIAEFLIEECQ